MRACGAPSGPIVIRAQFAAAAMIVSPASIIAWHVGSEASINNKFIAYATGRAQTSLTCTSNLGGLQSVKRPLMPLGSKLESGCLILFSFG